MQQLIDLWGGMDVRRRAMLLGGLAGLLTVLVLLARMATAPSYALLYSGLDGAAAGEVISALEARGVSYQVRSDSIHVPESDRDALRMSLAGEGVPALGAAGYELLDSLSGFGTTSQMFDAAYWRAKEGELARTISASPLIRAARVHIANPSSTPFAPDRAPSASVSIRPAAGTISASHAQALRYLVASAVPGLVPVNVAIIDSESGRVLTTDDTQPAGGDATGLSETLRRNVERLLSARVGPGNAVVEVSVELETARQTVIERIIDPDSRVVIGTESEESSNSSSEAGDAAVTVASNLPDGDGAAGGGGSSANTSETRERITYDISETQRETESAPGAVRRITVAVLVNAVPVTDADGVLRREPRDATELESLRDLVQSAIGFDEARGDVVTVQSMVFEPLVDELPDTPGNGLLSRLDPMQVIQALLLAAVALAVAFGVLRPALRTAAPALAAGTPSLPPLAADAAPQPGRPQGSGALPSPQASDPETAGTDLPEPVARAENQSLSLPQPDGATQIAQQPEDPVTRLRRLIEEREAETVEILRSWMEEDEELT